MFLCAPFCHAQEPTDAREAKEKAAKAEAQKSAQQLETEKQYKQLVAGLTPPEQKWEQLLQDNLGGYYLPLHEADKVAGRSNAWDFVKDDPHLPRILLIGDSISRGYTQFVREGLKGKANVHRAPENCGPTANGLKKIEIWLGDGKWDLIHFNFGIHDRITPTAVYSSNLEKLISRLQKTGAKLVWANTTPPANANNHEKFSPEDCDRLNAAAAVVMQKHGITTDDLFTVIRPHLAELQNPNDVHFKDEGYQILGQKVAQEISKTLGLTALNGKMQDLIKENFALADTQYRYMMSLLSADRMPQSYNEKDHKLIDHKIQWWCSGFYPGILWYIYEQTGDDVIRKEAERALSVIKPNENYTGNHDLGFMMYCSFGNAYRLTHKEEYKDVIFNSAKSLATRYRPSIKAIQSWDANEYFKCPVIIDNMMNLEMLNWVTDQGGDKKYEEIAIHHADTTMKNHFRKDGSSWHVVDYDLKTGEVIRKATWQGAADCSAWSRGQSWGLYGYTMMYRFTKDKKYLDLSKNIANFILNHPNLPKDKIPYWDFDAPKIPFTKRDASAAAIMASALLELGQYTTGDERQKYLEDAVTILKSLSGKNYRADAGTNGGFLLKHSTGAFALNSEIDVPLIYADYYFLEALMRYQNWYSKEFDF